ncbi:glycosyltransferase family 4 protein [Sphingobium chungbukense]|uniref:Glycosyl transferase family 1 domain-containing protein n=1 Tax=Sphingobium chungbukense TaxID=56193 RepID=A0A0M3ATC8_9SPHN|nr:glycosyltransferase family 4 protein [Sphingobium chungbukense]KKW93110.1 hypothetical protein YP76_05740 [Sphingobium chungbukense]
MQKIHIVSVMQPDNLWCRNHTLLMSRALCESYDIVILSDKMFPLAEEEIDFFPKGRSPTLQDIHIYFQYDRADDDFILYQLANNDHFGWIAECFLRHPGAVLMHDISLFWLFCQATGLKHTFIEEEIGISNAIMLKNSLDWNKPRLAATGVHSAYFNRAILQYASGIITHSPYQAENFRRKFPDVPVHSVPLVPNFLHPLTPLVDRTDLAQHRAELDITEETITFGVMGFQAFHKRLPELLEGFCRLEPDADVKLLLVGKWDAEVRKQCAKSIAELERRGWVLLVDRYVPEVELETFIAISDVVVNFRYPTAGESSGIACQALAVGVPLLVNKIGSFVDLHEDSVIRVPFAVDGTEDDAVADVLRNITRNPEFLRKKQQAARANVSFYRMPRYSADYCRIVAEQMHNYVARRSKAVERLAIRRENDAWYPKKRASGGHVAVILDSNGKGISLTNPLMGDREILSIVHREMQRSGDKKLDPNGSMYLSMRAIGEPLNVLEPGLDLSSYASLCLTCLPSGGKDELKALTDVISTLPIGARIIVPEAFLDFIAMGQGFYEAGLGKNVNDYMNTLLLEGKYAAEVGIYRYGLHILEDLNLTDQRFLVLRYGSAVHTYT